MINKCRKPHICCDSMNVYRLLSGQSPPIWSVLHIWRRIKHLQKEFSAIRYSHVYRETNRATDWLAGKHPRDSFLVIDTNCFDSEMMWMGKNESPVFWKV